jgi:hypothetical protein
MARGADIWTLMNWQHKSGFIEVGVPNAEEGTASKARVDTAGSHIGWDFAPPKADFLARYGHLRPGTYDILSPRYGEAADLYFDWSSAGDTPESFAGRILFVPGADPGFDSVFTRDISGFVTRSGSVNSHMAIRAGEALFRRWQTAHKLCFDCTNQKVWVVA